MNIYIVCLGMVIAGFADAKILILTHCYNSPEFIPFQHRTFQKFLKDDYEFVVFNDASDKSIAEATHEICRSLNIRCIDVPQTIHSPTSPYLPRPAGPGFPSADCADTVQYMFDQMGIDFPGIVGIVDSDMFLIRELSIELLMQDHQVAATPQYREGLNDTVTYFAPNLLFLNVQQLPHKKTLNFNQGTVDGIGVDTGGYTHYYMRRHPSLKWFKTNYAYARPIDNSTTDLDPGILNFFKSHEKLFKLATATDYDHEFYMDYTFLHFRAGSNWYRKEAGWTEKKKGAFFDALEELLQ